MEQDMIKRLKEILEYFKLSPSKLADEISINRSRLSHLLNGRNNPTLEVVQEILNKYSDINPDWLLFGHGSMIRPGIEPDPRDLFQNAELNKKRKRPIIDLDKADISGHEVIELQTKKEETDTIETTVDKIERSEPGSIKRITVYFKNNEYQDFVSEKQ